MVQFDEPILTKFATGHYSAGYERAALALGRLTGMLALAPAPVLSQFAHRLVDVMVRHALRSEHHAFTPGRYAHWRAGLDTLALEAPMGARSPRLLAQAVLMALAANPFAPIAAAARAAQAALRAVPDGVSDDERAATEATVAAGRALASSVCARHPSDLVRLAVAAANDPHFAPRERLRTRLELGAFARVVERTAEPSPIWAIDLSLGGAFTDDLGALRFLPFPGALPLASLRSDLEPEERHDALASATETAAQALTKLLDETLVQHRMLVDHLPKLRSSSRAPELAALLLAVGPLSSRQIEHVLAASRLGVRDMLGKLAKAKLLSKERINGTYLHSIALDAPCPTVPQTQASPSPFSQEALDEFDAAMAAADAVLARSGRTGPSHSDAE